MCLFLSPSLLPIHLDSLYTSFLSTAPDFSQIVSLVNAGDYYHLSHLRFENDDIDLHAGMVQAGITKTGKSEYARDSEMQETIARRALSRRFVHQLETMTPEIHGEDADIYWTLWANTMPKLVSLFCNSDSRHRMCTDLLSAIQLTAPALAIHDAESIPPVRATASQLQTARDIMTVSCFPHL